jgi:hypothetical protein
MGAPLLIWLVLALLAACQPAGDAPASDDPHAAITCIGCHNGGTAERGRASVPSASCSTSGCHADGGPRQVRLATATFEHRSHGARGDIIPSCAGCHTHTEGGQPLRASVDACALCHLPEVSGETPDGCQTCHREPSHVTLTSAGIPVPHANLPWVEIGCVRCHYDVADPPIEVAVSRCADCHPDVREVTRRGVGADLHPLHQGLTCTACHAAGAHHVRELSSAVSLVCSDCHASAHDLTLTPWTAAGAGAWEGSATCTTCHTQVHRAQQQLLLGILPGLTEHTVASQKFIAGMTCRSCHVPPAAGNGPPIEPIRGQALACASCHGAQYREVLAWWMQGLDTRARRTAAYIAAARRDLAGTRSDSAALLLASAAEMLELVVEAGGQHNLELADRVFRESVRRTGQAYQAAGARAPVPPELGTPPHLGLCSGCHYQDGPWDLRRMPADFHRELVRRQQQQ